MRSSVRRKIHRRDAVGMIAEERLPTLGWRASPPGHILGHAGLSDFDAELDKLAMNSWRSPEWIGDTHLADRLAYFQRPRRPAAAMPRFPTPIRSETGTMPTNHRLRLQNRQSPSNTWRQTIQPSKYQPIQSAEIQPLR